MAKKDQLTNKKPLVGNRRSHAMNQNKRVWNLNLQKVKIRNKKNQIITIKVSAKTLKTLKKKSKAIYFDYKKNPIVIGKK